MNLQAKIRILKNLYWHHEFDSFPITEDFCDEIDEDIKCGIFWVVYDEMCQHLEGLYNSTQENSIFQMTKARSYKIRHR